jgi:hypothetical protein
MKSQEITRQQPQPNGYIALITVLIISAVALAIATTVSFLSLGEAQASFATYKGEDILQFVEGCMEDALIKSWASNSYAGGNITRPEGTCNVTVSKSGTTWTLAATNSTIQYKRTIQTIITRSKTNITIQSWKEL